MKVNVKLYATLREGHFNVEMADMEQDSCIYDIIKKYELPSEQVAICLVNGRHKDKDFVLKDGDTVSLFPQIGG